MRAGLVVDLFTALARCAIVIAIAGCATEPETRVGEQHFEDYVCGPYLCGANSPVMDSYGMYDLSLNGAPNASGLVLQGFYKNTVAYTPRVWGGKLTASRWSYTNGFWVQQTLAGQALVGAYFLIGTDDGSGKSFKLAIIDVGSVQSWAQPNPAPTTPVVLESYVLDYTYVTGAPLGVAAPPPANMCSNPPPAPTTGATYTFDAETLGQYEASTLIFEGDRIDAVAKRDLSVDGTWINFGCAGHTLAKLALTGHTQAAQNAGTFVTTLNERTAMLKMLAADYCGDGSAFTVTGQPLRWADNHGWMHINEPYLLQVGSTTGVLEARWNHLGPVCLHRPRVDENATTLAKQTTFVDAPTPWVPIYEQVKQYCPTKLPPDCSDLSFAPDGYHLSTVTPTPALQPAP